jgi:transcriptional regulator with XRE-family HTH domain
MEQKKTLKDLIKEAGMTYDTFALKVGTDKSQVSNWNSRKKVPRLDNAVKMAQALGVSLRELAESLGLDVKGIPDDCEEANDGS